MTTNQHADYQDIEEGKSRITTYDENGIRTTKVTTKLAPDPNEKSKETVSVRTIQHPDSTETVTVRERQLPPLRYTETTTRERLPKQIPASRVQVAQPLLTNVPQPNDLSSIDLPTTTATDNYTVNKILPTAKTVNLNKRKLKIIYLFMYL